MSKDLHNDLQLNDSSEKKQKAKSNTIKRIQIKYEYNTKHQLRMILTENKIQYKIQYKYKL